MDVLPRSAPLWRLGVRRRRAHACPSTCSILPVAVSKGHRRGQAPAKVKREIDRYLQDVGQGIRRARVARGLTLEALAQQAGVSVRHLLDLESGGNTSLRTVAQLCIAMNVSPEGLPVPGALAAQTARAAAEVLGLDLVAPAAPRKRRQR